MFNRLPKYPAAAICTVIVILTFEIFGVWGNRHAIWDANYSLLEAKRNAISSHSPPDDIAIFGSSRFYHVSPDSLKSLRADLRVTNYSWGWCGIETYEGMLRGLIMANRSPRIILAEGVPELFGYRSELMTIIRHDAFRIGFFRTVPTRAAARTLIGMKQWRSLWELATDLMTPPSLKYRAGTINMLAHMYRSRSKPALPDNYDRIVTGWQTNGYFLYTPPDQKAAASEYVQLEQGTGPYKLRKSKGNLHSFERFVKLAADHNIKIILLPAPNNPLVFSKFTDYGIYANYDEFLSRLETKYPNFNAPQPRWIQWDNALGDAIHVNSSGAAQHEEFIRTSLNTIMSADENEI